MPDAECAMEIVPWALAALLAGILIGGVTVAVLGMPSPAMAVKRDESGRIVDVTYGGET